MIKLNGYIITPTIFPDKTSQVWKLPDSYIYTYTSEYTPLNIIDWEFEHEGEFLQIAQLKYLVDMTAKKPAVLFLNYLPYARQDKEISNTATFALRPFADLLNSLKFQFIYVFDPHNYEVSKDLIKNLVVMLPIVEPIVRELNATLVFPDKGAAHRYGKGQPVIVCDKIRDPLTGEIKGLTVEGTVEPKAYLIQDDICDGGRTFIEVAKKLYELGASEVHLYISHGIFSKGLDVLRNAGIKRIFTRNGEVK